MKCSILSKEKLTLKEKEDSYPMNNTCEEQVLACLLDSVVSPR
jgi:hypothetical protein